MRAPAASGSAIGLHPVIWALNGASNFVVKRILRIDVESDAEAATAEELRVLIGRGERYGELDPNEADMLEGVFHLHEQEARQVMTPTPALVTVNSDDTVEAGLRRCITSGHTRLVVIEDDNPDRVRGVVHSNRLAQTLMGEGPEAPLAPLVREPLIMPETKPLDDLLADMQRQRTSLAVIVDEFGRTAGIVTIEDIIEEIVGEIVDETDPMLSSIRRLVNGDWFVRGHVSLGDLEDAGIHLPVDSDAYTSVGRIRVRPARAAAQARGPDQRERLPDPRGVGAGEPRRGGPDPPDRSSRPAPAPARPRPRLRRCRGSVRRPL